MRIAALGDIHGNIIALERFIFLEYKNIDLIVCHGDIVNYAPWSNECVELMKTLHNVVLLKGNHEQSFINGSYEGSNPIVNAFFERSISEFQDSNMRIIESFDQKFDIDEYEFKHTIKNKYWFKDSNFNDLSLKKNTIIGHSHQQFQRAVGDFELYNTGSLGQNRKYINKSDYLILDTESSLVTLKSFVHNIDLVINEMIVRKYPKICIEYYLNKGKLSNG